jgi:flagellar hook protein FlgE
MSLFGALLTGVSGLDANSSALSVTASNIANVNTTAYKGSNSSFSTLVAAANGNGSPNSIGVKVTTTQNASGQGLLTSTTSDTDLAVSGDGFFITSTSSANTSNVEYTRAGDFSTDKAGYLVNSAGLYLLGYKLNTTTGTANSALSLINLKNLPGIAEASTKLTLTGNLESTATASATYVPGTGGTSTVGQMTSGAITPDYSTNIDFYDSQGGAQTLKVSFIKTAANTWAYEVSYGGAAANVTSTAFGHTVAGAGNLIGSGSITFDTNGALASVTSNDTAPLNQVITGTGTLNLSVPFSAASGLTTPQSIAVNFGTIGGSTGFTQYATASTAASTTDGAIYGDVKSISIGKDGTVTATYTNELTRDIFQIPLAIFANEDGLKTVSGTAYVATDASGSATITKAGDNGSGTVNSKQLEDSTVDLATELTNLITTQRAYSACAKIATTASTMLDDLLNTVR